MQLSILLRFILHRVMKDEKAHNHIVEWCNLYRIKSTIAVYDREWKAI